MRSKGRPFSQWRSLTAVEAVRQAYAALRAADDPAIFIAVRSEDDALAQAAALDAAGRDGKPLFGLPFAVKDNIDVAGMETTAACRHSPTLPEKSAFAVARLEAAGAICIGKTNLDQFATGLVGVRSPYGVPQQRARSGAGARRLSPRVRRSPWRRASRPSRLAPTPPARAAFPPA